MCDRGDLTVYMAMGDVTYQALRMCDYVYGISLEFVCERERETDKERETDTDRDKERERELLYVREVCLTEFCFIVKASIPLSKARI